MKKLLLPILILTLLLPACTGSSKLDEVITIYKKHEAIFIRAVETGDYLEARKISGIYRIRTYEDQVAFECFAAGFGSETSYYGFYYTPTDDLAPFFSNVLPGGTPIPSGNGWLWEEPDGDDSFYAEKIGEHFYYYEAHY